MIKFPTALAIAGICLTIVPLETRADRPMALRTQLAGATLDPDLPNIHHFDVKQGYYLMRVTDGLGRAMITTLYLYPAPQKNGGYFPRYAKDNGSLVETEKMAIPNIRKGWGVNIGDVPSQVQEKLGRAPDFSSYKSKTRSGTYLYKEPINLEISFEKRRVTWQYEAKYIFDKGRLRVIEYEARDPLPGN